MHLARLRWGAKARAEKRRVQRLPAGHRASGAELHKPRVLRGAEASGLERDARAGISPINSKPPVLAVMSKGSSGNERPDTLDAVGKPATSEASGIAIIGVRSMCGNRRRKSGARDHLALTAVRS